MPGKDRLTERKEAILHAVVQGYITTSRPVGSTLVTKETDLSVSSATVRKELGALEAEGFLHQPHTSAGRVPTEKGYRYFVDALMEPFQLEGAQSEAISTFFTRTHGELERMLKETSSLLAGVTEYAAVVVGPEPDTAKIRSVQLVDLAPRVLLMVVVLSNGGIERRTIETDSELSDHQIGIARDELCRLMIDQSQPAVVRSDTGDTAADDVVFEALVAFGEDERSQRRLYVGGQSAVAGVFDATETVERVLEILEKQLVVTTIIKDVLNRGMRVAIGTETGMENLDECSLVVAPYIVEGQQAGSIGVLGPTRMNYPQALAAVAIVSNRLGSLLSER